VTLASALYPGIVTHQRMRPKRHRLSYRVFWLLLDLAEIDAVSASSRIFSRNRFNLLSFFDRDYGDGSGAPLREQVESKLAEAGVTLDGGAIRLLTMPRMLGYVLNPLSIYYCHKPDGALAAVIYEVTSTFKLRYSYVVAVEPEAGARGEIRQSRAKVFYVSPFMDLKMRYDFRGRTPDARLSLAVEGVDDQGPLIQAVMAAKRVELSDRALLSAWLSHPLMTVKVIVGIHWEAVKLLIKGVPMTKQPAPPVGAVALKA
jgi:DUF1365 family protein